MSQLFILLSLLILSSCIQASSALSVKTLMARWMMYKDECLQNNSRDPPVTGLVCNRTFDKYACWPDGLPNTTVSVPCPWYLPWHRTVQHGLVYLECDADGQWVKKKNTSECEPNDPDQRDMQHYGRILSKFRAMYTVGYSLSLGALVLALGILVAFRKLHCMRNNIHMNLFASFILRASSILIKDALLERPSFNIDPGITNDMEMEWLVKNEVLQTAVGCRIAMVMMQYSIIANSYWLLVEGIYLHNLLAVTVLTEGNYFSIYLCIGWGAPLIVVLPWIIVKYLYENEECWEQNINMEYWWIIRSPILLAVLINFFIFIHIIKILVSKLRAHQMRYSDYKFRLAKSTLTLIPLLGIHQVLFSFVTDESTSNGAVSLRLTKLFIDLFFNSFQGLLVAILYCFVNKEVQSEILKRWKRWKLGKDIEEEYRHTYSNTAQVTNSMLVHASAKPRLPDIPRLSSPLSSPEEKHLLAVGCPNGLDLHLRVPLTSLPHEGATNSGPPEDPELAHRVQCYKAPQGNDESNL
ncbi:glucagon receptor isoform X1 [Pygocentrus nattereri]|uniref:glucagon receptor isoform X1 n=1 Tax=Pygocentrus nattereri TaxID=42514 RepID=UPI0008144B6E|nr:glucagon receptor isoform X1 [Pygocentrus nattereri]XP_017557106.1 glucagon receptor isoform X1 [Pygocentrus nattereri]XP_037397315.1 glucagon receptor isoform X1 [Pygocentrus nattereri]